MILSCNYEEVTALSFGARAFLEDGVEGAGMVAAPSEARAAVEALLSRLHDDISLVTLAEQRKAQRAVETVVTHLAATMEVCVLSAHPAAEEAVSAYFDYAHALSVLGRLREMGAEMRALVELMTGRPVDAASAHTFQFPD
jgi:hypothetical protein